MADAEIIAIGSEMLTSQRIDTNSLYITDQLNALGVEVRRKLIIGDDRALLTDAVRSALTHAGIVILTGGLGPTEDDVTRQAVADALNRELVFSEEICDAIKERFRRRQRKMAEINKRQAYVVAGAEVLPNTNGTAPGQWIVNDGRVVILLPGPPGELKPLFANECVPRLTRLLPAQVIRARFYRVTGFTESDLDALIAPVYTKYANPSTTILASPGDIQIHLRARCGSAEDAERLLAEVGDPIEALLGRHLFSRNGEPLEGIVGALLRERGATLSIAESCTGGMVGQRITSIAGSSDYFVGGFVTYTDGMKTDLLGVDAALISQHTAVSKEVAAAMAEGARARTGSTFAISITGEAGPESSTGAPVGTIFVGFAGPDGQPEALRFAMPGDRPRIRGFATQAALDLLRRRLLKLD
jgi:nicotinamide-nucleotide amidase